MAISRSLLLLFGVCWSSLGAADGQICSDYSIISCLSEFNEKHSGISIHTEESLDEMCSDYMNDVQPCLSKIQNNCAHELRLTLEGLADSYQYLCSTYGKAVYHRVKECLNGVDKRAAEKSCNTTYQNNVAVLAQQARLGYISIDDLKTRFCSATQTFLVCLYNEALTFCTVEAAQYQHKVGALLVQPTLDVLYNCHLGENTPYTGAAGDVQMLSVSLLILSLLFNIA